MLLCLLLVCSVVLGFYGVAISGGGAGELPPPCNNPPAATAGPILHGYFIAVHDQPNHLYKVSLHLYGPNNAANLFSFDIPDLPGVCDREDDCYVVTGNYIKTKLNGYPCFYKFGEPFNLPGIPVIKDLKLICRACPGEKIAGEVWIQVVPPARILQKKP